METSLAVTEAPQVLAPQYLSKAGVPVNGVTSEVFNRVLGALNREYGLSTSQVVEAASYSMAMVVRAALGLSAAGGRICTVASDSLSGWIALATMRHLANGGADPLVILVTPPEAFSPDLELQLKPLTKMQIPVYDWAPTGDEKDLAQLLESCHNTIVGLGNLGTSNEKFHEPLVAVINELPTPFHCIQHPLGINADTGAIQGTPIFASSTLSLGLPLAGLYAGKEHVGRHYVCDISIPREQYLAVGQDLTLLFADQPVVQLLPQDAQATQEQ